MNFITKITASKFKPLELYFEDTLFPYDYISHVRQIARAFVYDETNDKFAFIHVVSDDIFGKRDLFETSGGGVENGESTECAVRREVEEELGLKTKMICYIGKVDDYYNLIHRHNKNYYYLLKVDEKTKANRLPYEQKVMEGVYWFSLEEAINSYESHQANKVDKLVGQRELPLLYFLKSFS